jgi:hypothetical protein
MSHTVSDNGVWSTYQPLYGDLFSTSGMECYHCGKFLRYSDAWNVTQIIPSSQGGNHLMPNLRISCVACINSSIDVIPFVFSTEKGFTDSMAFHEKLCTVEDCVAYYQKHIIQASSCHIL